MKRRLQKCSGGISWLRYLRISADVSSNTIKANAWNSLELLGKY